MGRIKLIKDYDVFRYRTINMLQDSSIIKASTSINTKNSVMIVGVIARERSLIIKL